MTTKELYPEFPQEIRWHGIKVALLAKGITLSSLSKASGVTGIASAGKKNYPAAQAEIAKALGVSERALFPDRYNVSWTDELQSQIEALMPGLFGLPGAEPIQRHFADQLDSHSRSPADLSELPTEEPARLVWVKSALRERGFVLGALTTFLGIRRSALDNLGMTRLDSLQHLVAKCLGVKPEQIWPERYDEAGGPIPKEKTRSASVHREPQLVYRLDLTQGLWLPVRDLVGLPGMAVDETFIEHRAHVQGWQMRQRFGVNELAFGSLPELTKQYLLSPTTLGPEEALVRARRRSSGPVTIELASKGGATPVVALQVDVVEHHVKVTAVPSGETAMLNREEVSVVAAALLDASQEIPQ
ncbi:helix-turn-helix domain-containing protein [Pseudomonas sp. Irchel 3E13]|uniref:helix-turn-helix domain-containing protein n=1 Tax=Pseudomonas sp. Irchel 3E13 TaxID=2008975 RepID=UPI00117BA605|nr:helix-turn-helix domain-containing protein [Pseudomonas sp. Irchel 3E13]